MTLTTMFVVAFVAGCVVGLAARRHGPSLVRWLMVALIAAFAIHVAASLYIMAVDDKWSSGGTIAKHHPGRVLSHLLVVLLDRNIGVLVLGAPFVVGSVVGSSNRFRHAEGGVLRIGAYVGTCVGILVLTWVLVIVAWT